MNIRRIFAVSGNDHLINKLDDFAGGLVVTFIFYLFLLLLFKGDIRHYVEIFEVLVNRLGFTRLRSAIKKLSDVLLNIFADRHGKVYPAGFH